MNRELGILQISIRNMVVDQFPDPVMRDQEVPAPEKRQQRPPRHRENVVPVQSAPDGFQLQDALERGIAGIVSPVQGADAGSDHHIRGNSVCGERMHHAHLNGAKAAAACEYEGSFRRASVVGYGQSFVRSRCRRVDEKLRDVRLRL